MTDQSAARAPEPAGQRLLGALVSTALLAAFIGWQMGWVCAIAAVIGVFVHEYGHVLAMNALGTGPGRIEIVPFFGGVAIPRRAPDREFKGVLIALAGPLFGLLAMIPFFAAVRVTGDPKWLTGALFVAGLNLLNLAPAPPLDGSKAIGPALAWIHPWVERVALILVGAAAIIWTVRNGSVIFPIFIGLGVLGALKRGALRPAAQRLTVGEWLLSIALYLAVVTVVALALAITVGVGGYLGVRLR